MGLGYGKNEHDSKTRALWFRRNAKVSGGCAKRRHPCTAYLSYRGTVLRQFVHFTVGEGEKTRSDRSRREIGGWQGSGTHFVSNTQKKNKNAKRHTTRLFAFAADVADFESQWMMPTRCPPLTRAPGDCISASNDSEKDAHIATTQVVGNACTNAHIKRQDERETH